MESFAGQGWIRATATPAPYLGLHLICAVCSQVRPINAKALGGRVRDAHVPRMPGPSLPTSRRRAADEHPTARTEIERYVIR
jgi:hypothetical protein